MTAAKEKSLAYWIGVVLGLLALVGTFAKGSVRLSDAERKTEKIPGVEWDMRVVKSVMAKLYPAVYDSVVANEVRINGIRPGGEK